MKVINKTFVLAVSMTLACNTYSQAQSQKRNVLLIISDDQGYSELGAYMDITNSENLGAKNIEKLKNIKLASDTEAPIEVCFEAARKCMPNIDKLAEQGTRFTSFYAAPTCAPSRAALMSASYPQRYGVCCNDDVEGQFGKGFSSAAEFPVKLFQESGYMTGIIGKWHLGTDVGQHPNDRGFEYYFGFNRAHTEKYDSKILYRNRENVTAEGWLEDQISNEALDFLKRAEQDEQPFFLYVAYNVPHGPTPRPPQQYIDYINSGSDVVDVHFATIYGMDCGIGRMITQLKESGQLENTLILFGSDNGLARGSYSGFKVREQTYNVPVPGNGPLRGCKWSPWEGGVRVPFIARISGGSKGQRSDALLSIMDVLPTALDFAGIEVPDGYSFDGKSFLSILNGNKIMDEERILFWAGDSREPFGDFNTLYDELLKHVKSLGPDVTRAEKNPPAWYVRTDTWKLMAWDTITPVLIDIQNDIGERNDLSDKYPEIVEQLSLEFRKWYYELPQPVVYPQSSWEKFKLLKNKKGFYYKKNH